MDLFLLVLDHRIRRTAGNFYQFLVLFERLLDGRWITARNIDRLRKREARNGEMGKKQEKAEKESLRSVVRFLKRIR
jgi:hypothetical protein